MVIVTLGNHFRGKSPVMRLKVEYIGPSMWTGIRVQPVLAATNEGPS